jgi:hypothetical protein
MRLLFRRKQRSSIIGGRTIFVLDVRAEFSNEEQRAIAQYELGDELLYTRGEIIDPGGGFLGLASRLAFYALNTSITVGDLARGKRVECTDIVEMLAIEDELRKAADVLRRVLHAATQYGGEEVVEL